MHVKAIVYTTWRTAYCQTQGPQGCVLSSLLGFKNCRFNFSEGVTLMTHQVTPLTGQSIAKCLLMSNFQISSDSSEPRPGRCLKTNKQANKQNKTKSKQTKKDNKTGTRYHHLMESSRIGTNGKEYIYKPHQQGKLYEILKI